MAKEELTNKQEMFCRYYVDTGHATNSAIKAGYSEHTAAVIASENLTKPLIKDRIYELQEEKYRSEIMPQSERRARLSQFAREEIIGKHGYPLRNSNIQAIALLEQMDGRSGTQININIEDLKIAILNAKQDDQALIAENKPKLHLTESTCSPENDGGNTIV